MRDVAAPLCERPGRRGGGGDAALGGRRRAGEARPRGPRRRGARRRRRGDLRGRRAGCSGAARCPGRQERESVRRAIAEGRTRAFALLGRLGRRAPRPATGMDALRAAVAHLAGDVPPAATRRRGRDVRGGVGAALRGRGAGRARSGAAGSRPTTCAWSRGSRGERGRGARARHLPRDGLGSRHERVDLRRARGHLDRLGRGVGGGRGDRRAEGAAPRRRARAGARHARRDRGERARAARRSPGRAERWIQAELAAGRRIMGMGHRIYRVRDPRAAVLERAIERLGRTAGGARTRRPGAGARGRAGGGGRARARRTRTARCARTSSSTRRCCSTRSGLPRALFAPTFAVGRVAGWCAHIDEQRRAGRLIRPSSRYIRGVPAAAAPPH